MSEADAVLEPFEQLFDRLVHVGPGVRLAGGKGELDLVDSAGQSALNALPVGHQAAVFDAGQTLDAPGDFVRVRHLRHGLGAHEGAYFYNGHAGFGGAVYESDLLLD